MMPGAAVRPAAGLACAILLAWALAGCQQNADQAPAGPAPAAGAQAEPAPIQAAATTPPAVPAAAGQSPTAAEGANGLSSLVGDYRVAGVDEAGIDLPHGVAVRIDADAIRLSADCVELTWSYVWQAGAIETERLASRAGCGRALLRQEQAIADAFDAARTVRRTPANGIEFTGDRSSVLLFSQ